MVATTQLPPDKVRELQRSLFMAAKRNRERRFHALYDRIWRSDVLLEAWQRVRSNKGAAGIDGETLAMIEQQGVEAADRQGDRNRHAELLTAGQVMRCGPGGVPRWSST